MNFELDHVFILVKPKAKVADLLVSLGLKESFSRDHQGQGTSNRRFEFSNGMLEFLWVRDSEEASKGPGRNLQFPERAINKDVSPFGIILKRKDNSSPKLPFSGWCYQPDYFQPPAAFHVGNNSVKLHEPLCIYVPFVRPEEKAAEDGALKSISNVRIHTTTDTLSDELTAVDKADRIRISNGKENLMEITFDENRNGLSKDFRPDIPLIVYW